ATVTEERGGKSMRASAGVLIAVVASGVLATTAVQAKQIVGKQLPLPNQSTPYAAYDNSGAEPKFTGTFPPADISTNPAAVSLPAFPQDDTFLDVGTTVSLPFNVGVYGSFTTSVQVS